MSMTYAKVTITAHIGYEPRDEDSYETAQSKANELLDAAERLSDHLKSDAVYGVPAPRKSKDAQADDSPPTVDPVPVQDGGPDTMPAE